MVTYIFPGQGSQSKGMGGTLFDEFRELTMQADKILGYSIKELCMEDPKLNLSFTQYTQPALYTVNALSYLQRLKKTEKKPDFVVGHSLGEYNALFAAGIFDFEKGLKIVQKRGELMSRVTGGGMAALIGLNEEQILDVLKRNNLQSIDIANFNSPFQIVISGQKADIDSAKLIFEGIKDVKMVALLKTSGAFHSRYMEEAKKEFEVFLNSFEFCELTIPVISNVHARPYKQSDIKQNLIDQITHPVKWTESVRYLMGLGEMEFEEIGVGKVLTGLVQRIKKEAEPLVVSKVEVEDILKNDKEYTPIKGETKLLVSDKNNQKSLIKKPDSQESKTKVSTGSSLGKVVSGVIKNVQEKAKDLITSTEESDTKETKVAKVNKDKIKQNPREVLQISPCSLGSSEFKKDYNLKYAYLTGGMYRGIASKEMVVEIGKAGMMGFFGTGGLELAQIERTIEYIQKELIKGQAYGMNLIHNLYDPEMEEKMVDLFLTYSINNIEASAFLSITPALVKYRAKGLKLDESGKVIILNRLIAKISRPEVAEVFLSPAPERIISKLQAEKKITSQEADLLKLIPVADDICAEADSGGHTDGAVAYALMPAIMKLRNEMMKKYQYPKKIRVGAAGGIGTPEAAAAAFILGADFIVTGSINQCTVEADTSDVAKDLLQQMNVQDTEYAPAGDMFELGAKVQVLKKGLFFPVRANKLYDLYRQYNSLNEIDENTKKQIQEKYFKRSFEEVYEELKSYYSPNEIAKAERNPKHKMALVFRWYFGYSSRLAIKGDEEHQIDFQVHCGPALGAFNQWVSGTDLENWRNRYTAVLGEKIMTETAKLLTQRCNSFLES